jgi:hypothetical protein
VSTVQGACVASSVALAMITAYVGPRSDGVGCGGNECDARIPPCHD